MANYFYQDEERKKIKIELLTDDAKQIAHDFLYFKNNRGQIERRPNKKKHFSDIRLTPNQIRKFFNEVKYLQALSKAKGFETVEPLVKMLKSKTAYSANPKSQKIPEVFKNFIDNCVDQIHDQTDFYGFIKHFEAVVGYYYGYGEEA